MTPASLHNVLPSISPYPVSRAGSQTAASAGDAGQPADGVQLSPAALRVVGLTGRVAMNQAAGNVSDAQAGDLYQQIASLAAEVAAHGDPQTIRDHQSQLSRTIYSEAHGGAPPPAGSSTTVENARQALEAGRIALNLHERNLTADEARSLSAQLSTIHDRITNPPQPVPAEPGPDYVVSVSDLQNQLSRRIYHAAHDQQG